MTVCTGANLSLSDRLHDIAEAIAASAGIDDALDFTNEVRLLDEVRGQLDRPIAVAVVGEFSTGKSTFINAVLGEDLLPARWIPTTRQTIRISHRDGPGRVAIDGSTTATDQRTLSKSAVAELAGTGAPLVIETRIPPPWSNLVVYDTPGVNDLADTAEDILFDLMDQVDVVVFMLRADRAVADSEAAFLSRLVRQKDLDKLFFNVNFADMLDPARNTHERVRERVIETLGRLRNWPFTALGERVFLCSASEALAGRAASGEPSATVGTNEHGRLVAEVHRYAQTRRDGLLCDFADNVLRSAARAAADKLSAAIDVTLGKDSEHAQALTALTAEIADLRTSAREHEVAFAQKIRELKQDLQEQVKRAFADIRSDLHEQITKAERAELADAAWLPKRLRVETEDQLRAVFARFAQDLEDAAKDLDRGILPLARRAAERFEEMRDWFDFAPWVAGGGVAVAAYTTIAAAFPWLAGGAVVATAASFIPGVGAVIIGLLAAVAPRAGGAAVSVTQAVYGWVRDRLRDWQEQQTREGYRDQMDAIITRMQDEVLGRIQADIDPDRVAREVTDARFPQSQALDDRRLLAAKLDRARLRDTLKVLRELREHLAKAANEPSPSHD